ncbi:MAG: PAS domain-containing protein [Candidatus Binatia bacterium]
METTSWLSSVLVATGSGAWEWDVATGQVQLSREWLAHLGYDAGDVPPTREGVFGLVHPDDRERAARHLRAHLDGRTPECECVGRLRRKDGSYQWRRERCVVVARADDGAPLRMVGLGTNVADFGRAGAQAHPWEHVFDQTRIGLSITSIDDNRFVSVNDAFARMHGYTPDGLVGQPVDVTCAPGVTPLVPDLARRIATDGVVVDDFMHRRRDGSTFPARQEITLIRNADGLPVSRVSLVMDMTEREEALEALQEREQQLQLALDAADAGTFAFDIQRGLVQLSARCREMYGVAGEVPLGLPDVVARTHQDDRAAVAEQFAAALASRGEYDVEYRIVRPDGAVRWIHARGRAVYDTQGVAQQMVGVKHDITERKEGLDRLRSNEERFRLVSEATRDVLWDWNVVTGAHWWSPNAVQLFGPDAADASDIAAWRSRLHPDDRDRVLARLDAVLGGASTFWESEYRVRLASGAYGEFLDRGHVVRGATGAAIRMIGAMTDVTEMRRTHRSLVAAHQRLRAAGREVYLAESRERAALARELHDEFGQLLTAAKLSASWLKAHAPSAPGAATETFREKATNLCDVLDTALHGVRLVASQLRPPALDQLGLARAIEGLAAQVERHAGFECHVAIDEATRAAVFGPAEGAAIYRIAQELLTNAARHAEARHVRVVLATGVDRLSIEVQDDGRGFDPAAVAGGWGLKGLRERAELLDGDLAIDSRRDGGTTVRVTLPRGGGA